MRKLVYVKCPYCSFVNKWSLEIPKNTMKYTTLYCDIKEGGCDKLFLVKLLLNVSTMSFAIEGQGED